MRSRLADSVAVIAAALGEGVPPDPTAALVALRAEPVHPVAFALYHDAVVAAFEDRAQDVAAKLRAFSATVLDPLPFSGVTTLRDEDLGPGMSVLYARLIDNDEGIALRLTPVAAPLRERMRVLLGEARALVRVADAGLSAEVELLGRQIVVAQGGAGAGQFGSAATFFLWGAALVNPDYNPDRLTLAESLVHETGHALLFGLANAEALVLNAPGELYASPLRADLRPMEGLVHATYVCARMVRFVEAVLEWCDLSLAERDKARQMVHESRSGYHRGLETVSAHARFSQFGREIFETESLAELSA